MSKPIIKFQPVNPIDPSKAIAKNKSKKSKVTIKETPYKIFLNNRPIGFIRVKPTITIFIKGNQLPGKQLSINTAKSTVINFVSENLKLFK